MTTHRQSDLHVTHIKAASFWGFGTTLYGWRPAPDGGHIVTRWITFLFFPIVPLGSYVIDFTKDGRGALDYVISYLGFIRDSLGGEPLASLCWRQVVNTYLYVYMPWAIGLCSSFVVPIFVSREFHLVVSFIMPSVIMASWFYAAIMMRRAFRTR